jgi:N-acetylglucosamine-6-phosphate deacetylase
VTDLLITNARVVLANRVVRGAVAVTGEHIEGFVAQGEPLPDAARSIDVEGRYLAPGFIDIHIHGAAGVDVMDADDDGLERMAAWLASRGVTRFLPTLVPVSLDDFASVSARLAAWFDRAATRRPRGALSMGIHYEGPFVSRARCGALHTEFFLEGAGAAGSSTPSSPRWRACPRR